MPIHPIARGYACRAPNLARCLRGRLAAQFISELATITLIPVDLSEKPHLGAGEQKISVLAQEAADVAVDYGLRGMDAIYVAVAPRWNCPLVTLDDDPHQRASSIITVLTAAQALTTLRPAT